MKTVRKLLVVARVDHYRYQGRLYSYTPYAREIELWADLFPQVLIAGTCRDQPPPGDCMPFTRPNITMCPVAEAGGHGFNAKLRQAFLLPIIMGQVLWYMLKADAIHARCPCDLGLLGILFGPLFSRRLIAKYATQWLPFPNEPWSWRLQRALLRSWWWRGPVTVYGHWPNQPSKITPFFTSMLTEEQIDRARAASARSRSGESLRILFVGRLSPAKNADVLLRAVASARVEPGRLACTLVGEGPERAALEKLADELGIRPQVKFTGGLDFEDVLGYYERSDMLVLASDIEGWPKAVAEAMAFGLVCAGSQRGLMPQMLGEGRGLLVPPRDVAALRAAVEEVANQPAASAKMASQAAAWAQRYSLEGLREALRQLMRQHWGVILPATPPAACPWEELGV